MQDSFTTCPQLDIVLFGVTKITFRPGETEKAFLRKIHWIWLWRLGGVFGEERMGKAQSLWMFWPLPEVAAEGC